MTPLKIGALASEEFQGAVRWYEERVHTTDLIMAHPEIGEVCKGRFPSRQLRVLGFPFYVAYRVREDDVYVVAIAHTSRRPGYWSHRS